MPDRYYAFEKRSVSDIRNVQFLALDTTPMVAEQWADNPGRDDGTSRQKNYVTAQKDGFLARMDQDPTAWQIAFGHHPYVSNGPHGNAGEYDKNDGSVKCQRVESEAQGNGWACGWRVKEFIDTLCDEGLDLYLSGHDHSLQAFSAPCGKKGNEVDFIVSGAGTRLKDSNGVERHLTGLPGQQSAGTTTLFQQQQTLGFVVITAADSGRRLTVNIVDASSPTNPQALFTRRLFK